MGWNFYNASGELQINDGGVSATAASITNDLTVTSGNVVIATAGKGIDFSAQADEATGETMGAELLDHFEEGTFTPVLWDASDNSSESQAYNGQTGRYQKIGNWCVFSLFLRTTSIGTLTTSNQVFIGGLPFTSANRTNGIQAIAAGSYGSMALGTAGYGVSGDIGSNSAKIRVHINDTTTSAGQMIVSEWSADGEGSFFGSYETA